MSSAACEPFETTEWRGAWKLRSTVDLSMQAPGARRGVSSQVPPILPSRPGAEPKLRILLSAYACEPDKGSEAAVGWNWAKQAARFHDVWVITRSTNRASIEADQSSRDDATTVRWIYYDLPTWLRGWKRQRRGLHLYYVIWQFAIFQIAKRLHRTIQFDLVHHVTFASYWTPSFLGFLNIPFIWGPVGGGESAPKTFYPTLSARGRRGEHLRDFARWAAERTPLLKAVARSADLAFATTEETGVAMRRIGTTSVRILSQVALSSDDRARYFAIPDRTERPFRVVSVGNLIALKGFHLGLTAFAAFLPALPDSEYWLIGDGPERSRLERLARTLGVLASVRFVGEVPRAHVPELLRECDVFVHPSLHDSGGYACVEAMACGRPVICLALGGPAMLVDAESGIRISAFTPDQTQRDLAEAIRIVAQDPALRARLGAGARRAVQARCDWASKGDLVYGQCARRLASSRADTA